MATSTLRAATFTGEDPLPTNAIYECWSFISPDSLPMLILYQLHTRAINMASYHFFFGLLIGNSCLDQVCVLEALDFTRYQTWPSGSISNGFPEANHCTSRSSVLAWRDCLGDLLPAFSLGQWVL